MKTSNWVFFAFVCAMLILSVAVVACGGDDDDDDADDGQNTWHDAATGLVWQNVANSPLAWDYAVEYCDELEFDGHSDWRLPSVDEMRSLVLGCDATASDGACAVTDLCLEESCETDDCDGCENLNGPGNEAHYCDPALTTEGNFYWTSSTVTDETNSAWYVDFISGKISTMGKLENEISVRCVR